MKYDLRTQSLLSNNGNNLTHSQLILDITPKLFKNGHLQLRCFAEIPSVYKASDSITVMKDDSLISLITGDETTYHHRKY